MSDRPIRRVLAWDPGIAVSYYALLESGRDSGNRVRFLDGGKVSSDLDSLSGRLEGVGNVACVAVETPRGFIYQHARGAALLETRGVAERIAIAAQVMGHTVVQMPATEWRKALCGKGNASDDQIKRMVQMVTVNLPTRSSEHVRDAIGLACMVLWNPRLMEAA
jgi:Holliday junction resolvasome RuvABC endonuclease subunit